MCDDLEEVLLYTSCFEFVNIYQMSYIKLPASLRGWSQVNILLISLQISTFVPLLVHHCFTVIISVCCRNL